MALIDSAIKIKKVLIYAPNKIAAMNLNASLESQMKKVTII
jgi:hypothetical protein